MAVHCLGLLDILVGQQNNSHVRTDRLVAITQHAMHRQRADSAPA
jgi:hypothetical protein